MIHPLQYQWVTDHCAPVWVPRGPRPAEPLAAAIGAGSMLVAMLTVVAVLSGTPGPLIPAAAVLLLVLAAVFTWRRWLHRCGSPTSKTSTDKEINLTIRRIQLDWRRHPEIREAMEPVLTACYRYARDADLQAITKRRDAVKRLAAQAQTARIAAPTDDSDLFAVQELTEILARQNRNEPGTRLGSGVGNE